MFTKKKSLFSFCLDGGKFLWIFVVGFRCMYLISSGKQKIVWIGWFFFNNVIVYFNFCISFDKAVKIEQLKTNINFCGAF